jgi:molybdopterin/thiamine biosynthesis adenylyltransferase
MESRICVLGSTAIGTETLKNLVLPGCGNITIVDDALVKESDLGNNFFVTEEDIGKSRAEVRQSQHA